MKILIKNRVFDKFDDLFAVLKIEREDAYHRDTTKIDLSSLTRPEVERLYEALKTSGVQGTRVLAADVKKYLKAADGGIENITARSVRQAAWMLEHYIAHLPHHILFSEDEYEGGSHVGYFVTDVKFNPEEKNRDRYVPPTVLISFCHIENEKREFTNVTLGAEDTHGKTPVEMLASADYVPETPALLAKLERETNLYYETRERIGKKYKARGIGVADLDNAGKSGSYSSRYGRRSDEIRLDNFGAACHVVVDVLHETDSEERSGRGHSGHVDLFRWHTWNMRFFTPKEDDLARHLEADEDSDFAPDLQIPVHPLVPVFDLGRHVRCRVHVNNLAEYEYRTDVDQFLSIPEQDREMVNMLLDESRNTFADFVTGKGQSMNILLEGGPGTGKTLTTEIFAEHKQMPLYSVQCSQLGLKPDEVEKNLRVILQRANRWNAVLLLDEADVYIRKRGTDLQHNAIVGVFLRVLEQASCILVMTTNIVDDSTRPNRGTDDAIASRCIIRMSYELPTPAHQTEIWRNLARVNKIDLSDATIKAFVEKHPRISGRDVKNILKLASIRSKVRSEPVDLKALEFALQYKPTASQ
jgi:Cdc6-like AAA superfamily ATPase